MVDSSKTAKLQLKMRPRSPIIMSGRSKIGICESSLKSVNKLDKNTKYSVLPDESPIVHMQNRPKKFKYSNLQSTPYAQNIKKSITESREIINLSPIAATSTTVIDNPVNGTDIFPCHLLKCKREIPMDCSIDPNTSKINNSKEIKSKLKFSTHLKAQSPESNLCEPLMISEIANKKSLKHKNENTKRCLFENEKLSSSNSDMDQDSLNISLDTLEQVCQMSERTLECSNKNVNNLVSFLYGNTSTKLENTVVENDLLRLALKMEDFITNEKKPKKVLEVETNFTTLNKLQKNENTSFQNSKKCKNDNVHSTFFTNSTQLTTNNLMSTNEIGNTQMCEIADIIEPLSSFDDQWTQQYTLNSNIQVSSSSNCNQGAVHNLKLKCDVQSSNNEHKYSYTYKSENKMYKPLTENTEFSTPENNSLNILKRATHKSEVLVKDDKTLLSNEKLKPLNIPQATTNEFKGFSTATGKAIKVPEQALRQAEALLKDDQAQSTNGSFNILIKADEPSNKLKSFSTDKSVMISENTTQMAQIVFKDGNCVVNKLSSYNDNLLKIDNKKKILQSVSKCNIGKSDILGNIEDMNVEVIDEFFSNDSFILSENKLLGTGNKPAFKELQNLKNTTHNSTHDKKSLNDGLNDTQSILEDISLVDTVERIEKGQQHFLNTTSHNKRPGSPNYDIEKIIKKPILDFGWEKNELEKSFKVYLSKKLSSQKTSLSTLVDYSLPKKSTANQHFNGNYDFANFDSNKSLDFKLCWDYNRSNTEANFYNFNDIKNLFESHFLVDVKLIPKSWVENHFHWIIWKLASMELSFPNLFANKLLTAKNTIHELLYRYYREIEKCQRSVLKKILEKDDVATKRMILCVSKIIKSNTAENYNIELTDGWYKVQGLLDSEMNTLIHRQVVKVGTKLLISNAELVGAGEGIDPLQVHDGVKLKISTNSTRRVRWYAKLGLCKYPTSPVPISLESVLPHGGTIGSLSLVVLRKYPMLYFERKLNSKSVFRNEKMEIFEEEKHKTTQQKNLEKISNNIQSEMERELMSKTKNKIKLIKITKENIKNYSIEELSDIIENCMDPSEIQSVISEDKLEAIQNYKKTQHDNFMYELKKRVDNVFNDQFKDNKRRVTPLLKLRVVDEKDACSGLNFAVLTIWNPSESVSMFFDTISEGHCCVFSHLTATGYMNGELQLSAGKQSHYVFKKIINNYAKRAVISAKTFWSGSFSPLYSELDLVGIVIGIIKENETFNEVYVTDTEMNIVSIVFRGDFKEFGCDDKMLYPGSIISGMNLVFKGFHSNTPIPKVYVTELSLFTTVPKAEHLKQCSDDYIKFLKNSENFIQLCQNKIVEFQNKKSDVPSHDIDVYSLNVANKKIQKPYGESPSAAVSSPHVFQSEFSPVRKRLKMLNAYGKTPPLNIIHTKPPNKKLMNQFKTPNRM